jgi:TPR repeat protein
MAISHLEVVMKDFPISVDFNDYAHQLIPKVIAHDADAMVKLADCYLCGRGKPIRHKSGIKLYKKALRYGSAKAHTRLGFCYQHGLGVALNLTTALDHYRIAYSYNEPEAMVQLGICFLNGSGVEQRFETAFKYFKEAALNNVAQGQFYLGWCFFYGKGTDKDFSQAYLWFQQAARQGHGKAWFYLGKLLLQEQITQSHKDEIGGHWRKAIHYGYYIYDEMQQLNAEHQLNFVTNDYSVSGKEESETKLFATYLDFVRSQSIISVQRDTSFATYLVAYITEYRETITNRALRQKQHPLSDLSRLFDGLSSAMPEDNQQFCDRIVAAINGKYFYKEVTTYIARLFNALFLENGQIAPQLLQAFIDPHLDLLSRQEYFTYLDRYATEQKEKIVQELFRAINNLLAMVFITNGKITSRSPYFINYIGRNLAEDIENQSLYQESFVYIAGISLTFPQLVALVKQDQESQRKANVVINECMIKLQQHKEELALTEQQERQLINDLLYDLGYVMKLNFYCVEALCHLTLKKVTNIITVVDKYLQSDSMRGKKLHRLLVNFVELIAKQFLGKENLASEVKAFNAKEKKVSLKSKPILFKPVELEEQLSTLIRLDSSKSN